MNWSDPFEDERVSSRVVRVAAMVQLTNASAHAAATTATSATCYDKVCKKLRKMGWYKAAFSAASLFGSYCLGELLYVAYKTPRLPEAPGPVQSELRKGAIRLLCLGDSVAAGCGLKSNDEACAGTFARATSRALQKPVDWRVIARNGYTAKRIQQKHVHRIADYQPDVVVLSVGVNNLLEMQSEMQFEKELTDLLHALRKKIGREACIVVLGMPPMSMFVALTPLLRMYAGYKAKQFNQVMARVCGKLAGTSTKPGKQIVHVDYQGELLIFLEDYSPSSLLLTLFILTAACSLQVQVFGRWPMLQK